MAKEDKDEVQLPLSEEEAIAKQRKHFVFFIIAGIVMLVLAFFAGRTVKDWVSDDDSAPVHEPVAIVKVIDEEV